MGKLRPYLALDIETTGLDTEKSNLLQIGWVIDDGVSPVSQLKRGSLFIQNDVITYGENYALGMNAWIFQELMKPQNERKYPSRVPEVGIAEMLDAVIETSELAQKWDIEQGLKPGKKVQLAGKNVASFDWPIIRNVLKRLPDESYKIICSEGIDLVDHRFIDCGAIFFEKFGRNPGFNAINKHIGWKDINHDALDDAINVVVAIRKLMGIEI